MDTKLLVSILLLITAGFFIFLSASLGLLARDTGHASTAIFKQLFFGLIPGLIALYSLSRVNYLFWRKSSFYLFVIAIILNLIIFIPGVGFTTNGATRWLILGAYTLQVSEVLKIAVIMYFAAWLSSVRERVSEWKYGIMPLAIILSICAGLLLAQPDTDTLVVIAASLVAMFLAGGGKWRHVAVLLFVGLIGLSLVVVTRPYLKARVENFLNPAASSLSSGYQLQQSLIAIGSGGITGKGFGQSVQKFGFLPEPVGDSIFAVAAEEFGFIGSISLIILFVFFTLRAFKVAANAVTTFGGLLVVGVVSFMIAQSFINISAMMGVLPLSGIPLLFVSQGGTALLLALAEAGIILNVSRHSRVA
jgi:cell division protein FtsW